GPAPWAPADATTASRWGSTMRRCARSRAIWRSAPSRPSTCRPTSCPSPAASSCARRPCTTRAVRWARAARSRAGRTMPAARTTTRRPARSTAPRSRPARPTRRSRAACASVTAWRLRSSTPPSPPAADPRDPAYPLRRSPRGESPAAQREATEQWWADFLAPAHLPDTDDPLITAFARRSLIVARTATDDASGAIVASVDTQNPYGADWLRDGSFINYALDLAGYTDLVSRHNHFYARVQRKEPAPWSILYHFATRH